MKSVTGIIVLGEEGCDMAAFSPAHNIGVLSMLLLLYLYIFISNTLHSSFGVPADGSSSCLFLSGCIRQDRAARHSLVRVETAEGRKRNARKVQKCRAVLKSRLVVSPSSLPPSPFPLTLLLISSRPGWMRRSLSGRHRSSALSERVYPASSLDTGPYVVSASLFSGFVDLLCSA